MHNSRILLRTEEYASHLTGWPSDVFVAVTGGARVVMAEFMNIGKPSNVIMFIAQAIMI